MQDIFITKLSVPLDAWKEAFPMCQVMLDVPKKLDQVTEPVTFWLHMNEDRQQWMQNALGRIFSQYQNAKVIVLANLPNQAEALYALSLGSVGYIHAYASANLLSEVKTVVAHGGLWMGHELLQKLIDVSTKLVSSEPQHVEFLLSQLTQREKEVAIEAAKGLSNKEIARLLSITERTVKAHLASIFETLKAKDRLQLALMLNQNYQL